jgi:UTP--glucose-1-phosphate uridylyltransferase
LDGVHDIRSPDLAAVKVAIPAAGLGARFASTGQDLPKELLPLGGKPLIAHALAEAARAGFEGAVVVVSPAKRQLHEFLRGDNLPIPVEIVVQPQPLGIGEAILRCWRGEPIGALLPDDVVLATDHWARLIELHSRSGAAALCVREVPLERTSRFGIAECAGGKVVALVEKPPPGTTTSNLAVFGRYLVTAQVIAGLRRSTGSGEMELTYGFSAALAEPPGVGVVTFYGEIYDCGTPSEYALSIRRFPA